MGDTARCELLSREVGDPVSTKQRYSLDDKVDNIACTMEAVHRTKAEVRLSIDVIDELMSLVESLSPMPKLGSDSESCSCVTLSTAKARAEAVWSLDRLLRSIGRLH